MRTFLRWFSAVISSPRRNKALPPRATTILIKGPRKDRPGRRGSAKSTLLRSLVPDCLQRLHRRGALGGEPARHQGHGSQQHGHGGEDAGVERTGVEQQG